MIEKHTQVYRQARIPYMLQWSKRRQTSKLVAVPLKSWQMSKLVMVSWRGCITLLVPGSKKEQRSLVDSYQGGTKQRRWSNISHGDRVAILSFATLLRFQEECLSGWGQRNTRMDQTGTSGREITVCWNQLSVLRRRPCNFWTCCCSRSSPSV